MSTIYGFVQDDDAQDIELGLLGLAVVHESSWSITYEQLLDVETAAKELFGLASYRFKTMRDITENIVLPRCQRRTSYALSLNPNGLPVDAFVTHCWDGLFVEFVDSIRQAFQFYPKKPNLWVCSFALPQGGDGNQRIVGSLLDDRPLQDTPFAKAIVAAQWFVVVRNSTTDLYSRIWCVCELLFARHYDKTTMVLGRNTFADDDTSCEEAEASHKNDKTKILAELHAMHGSIVEIDRVIREYRRYPSCLQPQTPWGFLIGLIIVVNVLILTVLWPRHGGKEKVPGQRPDDNKMIRVIPQDAATSWLEQHPDYNNMSKERRNQLLALATLFYSTNGPNWKHQWDPDKCVGWLDASKHECDWGDEIICGKDDNDASGRKVERLLSEMCNLHGPIPTEISLLGESFLELSLRVNALNGQLPSEIGLLLSLEKLDLDANPYMAGGALPSELGKLAALEMLSLRNINLNGAIPTELGLLTNVWYAALDRNHFNSTLPSQVGLMTSLQELYLTKVPLTGTIPPELGNLTRIKSFSVGWNDLTGSIPTELGLLTAAEYLWFDNNKHLSGSIPSEFGLLTKLKRLWLYNVDSITGEVPREVLALVNSSKLDLQLPDHMRANEL